MTDRIVTFVVGALLAALGAGFILWHFEVEWVRDLVAHADQRAIAAAPRETWWRWMVGAAALALATVGALLLAAKLRPRRVGSVELTGSTEFGMFTAHTGQVASAVATLLARHSAVASATATTRSTRGRRSIRITVVAEQDVTLDHVRRLAAESARDIGTALAGTDIVVDVFVQVAPPLLRG